MKTIDVLELLNPWWKTKSVSKDLAFQFKRRQFKEITTLLKKRSIIILTGLRRVGKTTLLYQCIEQLLLANMPPTHIVYFNLDKEVRDVQEILDAYSTKTGVNWKEEKITVLLDEISKLKDWARHVKLIYDAFPNIHFLVSSSSSTNLEHEALQHLGGRYFLKTILPLSFREYLSLKGKKELLENSSLWEKEIVSECNLYMSRTFPEIIEWTDDLLIKEYLSSTMIDKIVKADIPEKFKNVHPELLKTLLNLILSEPGIVVEYDALAKNLGVSKRTIYLHLHYLEFSYLIRRVKNYRVSTLSSSRKRQRAYAYWWSLAFPFIKKQDLLIENAVGSTINSEYYWREGNKEVDFLKIKGKDILPIEVKNKEVTKSDDVHSMIYFLEKYNREKGIIVTSGEERSMMVGRKHIVFVPLWKFFLEQE